MLLEATGRLFPHGIFISLLADSVVDHSGFLDIDKSKFLDGFMGQKGFMALSSRRVPAT
jgi:hypothetical protein